MPSCSTSTQAPTEREFADDEYAALLAQSAEPDTLPLDTVQEDAADDDTLPEEEN